MGFYEKEAKESKIGYMCMTSFEFEMGADIFGTKVFPSIKSLKAHNPCWSSCGIAKVSVTLEEVVQEGDNT